MCHINDVIFNKQGLQLTRLKVDFDISPNHRLLRDIIIHSVIVFTHKENEALLQPFVKLIFSPATLKVCRFLYQLGKYLTVRIFRGC